MKIDSVKIKAILEAEIGEMLSGAHKGVKLAIGSFEMPDGAMAQVQINITINQSDRLKENEWSLKCIES
jgi:hypothetical protein